MNFFDYKYKVFNIYLNMKLQLLFLFLIYIFE